MVAAARQERTFFKVMTAVIPQVVVVKSFHENEPDR
jgi:hypothetical protein